MDIRCSLLITALVLGVCQFISAQHRPSVDRVEPPCWWVDMAHPELQLMVHGEHLAGLIPSIDYEGVVVKQVDEVENVNYMFINLLISDDVRPGKFRIVFNKNGTPVFSYPYEFKQRIPDSAKRKGFSGKDIVYLITPDRFANGNSTNDTILWMREQVNRQDKNGRHGGDIQGIIDHLDYIQDMGFTAIWVNPLLENDMERSSYHGYSTTDYYRIDAHYGTNSDFVRLSEEAKKRGMLLIMDMIVNHCGLNHWWTGDEPTGDWYHFQDMEVKPFSNHQRVTLADPYVAQIDKRMHADGWFVPTMPDLNQSNPLLANYLIQNSIWWVEFADLGGIRQDTYPYPDATFMTEWSRRMMQEYPNFNMVGEEWSVNPAIVSRWQAGKENANGYVSYLPSLMDFPLQDALVTSLNKPSTPHANSFSGLYEMLANDFLYADPFNLMIFADNHDMARIYNQVHENIDLLKMALVYLYTTRGIPQIFYGTEIMMGNAENPGDHTLIRSDMPGGWPGDQVNAFTGEGLTDRQLAIQALVKKLTRFRRDTPALQHGELQHYAPVNEVYVMFRWDDTARLMTVFNKNPEAISLDLARFSESLNGATRARNVLTTEEYDLGKGVLDIPGTSARVMLVE